MAVTESERWMREALRLARRAEGQGEVPIGALVVQGGKVVGRGFNLRESKNMPTAHAELLAIEQAARRLGRWRLTGADLYVTLEPCLMCWGAIVLARISKLYFGAYDPKAGVCGSVLSLHEERRFNHHPKIQGGLLKDECGKALSEFFKKLRGQRKQAKGA